MSHTTSEYLTELAVLLWYSIYMKVVSQEEHQQWILNCLQLQQKEQRRNSHYNAGGVNRSTWASAYNTETRSNTGGSGWSTPGDMSKNGAEIDIQSFLSDGAVLPRETEMRTRRFAHSTRLLAQTRTKKNPFVTRYQANSAFRRKRTGS